MKLLVLGLFISGCTPCWDKQDNAEVVQCLARYPVESIKDDSQVSDYLKNHKVYVSLTTSPKRISNIHWVLKSLDLTYVDTIYLALPEKYKNKEEYQIPENLTQFTNLKIIRRSLDLGPVMKLLPAIEEVSLLGDPDAIVITVDDDTAYPKGMMAQLIKENIKKKGVINGCGGAPPFPMSKKYWPKDNISQHQINFIEGNCGVSYRPRWVNTERMKSLLTVGTGNVCKTSDDLVISWVLAEDEIPRYRVRNSSFPGVHQLQYGFEGDALHNGSGCSGETCGNEGRYLACAKALYLLL